MLAVMKVEVGYVWTCRTVNRSLKYRSGTDSLFTHSHLSEAVENLQVFSPQD